MLKMDKEYLLNYFINMCYYIFICQIYYTKKKVVLKFFFFLFPSSLSLPDSLQPSLCTTSFNRSGHTSSRQRSSSGVQSPTNLLQPKNDDWRRQKSRNSRSKRVTQVRFRCRFSLSPPQRPSSSSDLLTTLLDKSNPRQLRREQPHPKLARPLTRNFFAHLHHLAAERPTTRDVLQGPGMS